MTEDTNGRVTLREVYDLLAEFRAEVSAKFDELPRHYASIDSVEAIERRVHTIERGASAYVAREVHDMCRAQVTNLEADTKELTKKVWMGAGIAAVIGSIVGPLITLVISH